MSPPNPEPNPPPNREENEQIWIADGIDQLVASVLAELGIPSRDRRPLQNEVCEFFLKNFEPGRGARSTTYAYEITRRKASNYRRRMKRQEKLLSRYADHMSLVNPPAMRNEMLDLLERALERLPKQDRELVQLYYFDGLVYREIEAKTGIRIPTAQRIVTAAVEKLRKIIDDLQE